MIAHIVFFRLKDPTPENLAAARDMLLSMEGKLPMLRHLEVGIDLVRSERSFDIALYSRFDSMDDLNAYQVAPYHAEVIVPYMKGVSAAIHAVDYELPKGGATSDC